MKKYIGTICWLLGAIIWFFMAWTYYSESRIGFAIVQVIVAILFLVNAVRGYVKNRKK